MRGLAEKLGRWADQDGRPPAGGALRRDESREPVEAGRIGSRTVVLFVRVAQEAISSAYSSIDPERFPTLAAAMGEAMALLSDDEAQFETGLDALVRGLEASFRVRGLLG